MADLSDKQKKFCEEYIKDCNGKKAAIRAGYSERTAQEQAARMLSKVKVKAYMNSIQAERRQESRVDQEWVLEKFKEIARITMKPNDKGKIDAHGAARALENIAKHLGFYEKDNKQLRSDTTFKIEIINPTEE